MWTKEDNLASALKFAVDNPERVAATKKRWQDSHKEQVAEARSLWKEQHPEEHLTCQRRSHLMRKYNMTIERYEQMEEAQGYVCAICGGPQNPKYKYFDIDHNHTTNVVRGLLCRRCNIVVGVLEKAPAIIKKAFAYLGIPCGL
jgi:hypothetical protein